MQAKVQPTRVWWCSPADAHSPPTQPGGSVRALHQALENVKQKSAAALSYRTCVLQHAKTCSALTHRSESWLVCGQTETDGDVQLHWAVDREALQTEMRPDGRYCW